MKSNRGKDNIELIRNISQTLVLDDISKKQSPVISDALGKAINELQIYQAELEMQNEELRLMQNKLESNRNKYYELFNHAPSGYFLLDNHFSILEANVAALSLLGVNREEVTGRSFIAFIRKQDHQRVVSLLNIILRRNEKHSILAQIQHSDRSFRIIKLEARLTDSTEFEEKQIMLTSTDLTELEKTRSALEESENLHRSLIQSSFDHIFMLSADGFFWASNDNVEHLVVDSGDALIGKNLADVYPESITREYIAKLHEVVSTGEAVEFEYDMKVNGDERYHTAKLYPIVKNGHLWAIGGISHDITEQKQIEEQKSHLETQVRHTQKLESLGNLAGGIAHDFNNILSAVLGYCELALSEAKDGTTLKEDLMEIYRGGNRAKELVKQILVFARQSKEEIKIINVAEVAIEVIKLIRSTLPKTIEIITDMNSDSCIMGNETQVHQIFLNLCTNAFHAMEPDGGKLTVSIRDVIEELPDQGGRQQKFMEIKVGDTGCGIEPAMLEYIFDPYFTTKQKGDGSGMGLAMVHSIVESYQGRIQVVSKSGKGTVFTIKIPIMLEGVNGNSRQNKEIVGGSESIFFIDDEAAITRMSKQSLEKLGYSVTTSTNSLDALNTFRNQCNDFDLVITDMTMPYLTGDKLAVEFMKIRSDIPIILCSGYNKNITPEQIKELGIKAYITKPVVLAQLAETVRSVLDTG